MTALEQGPEMQQETLASEIEARLQESPEISQDRNKIFDGLSRNKEVALAGLLLTIGTLASSEAQAEFYYQRPENVKQSETEILQNFKDGDENTVYRYGQELVDLTAERAKQGEETAEAGEAGRAIIEQLSRMMMFCKKHGVELKDVYDVSKINPDFVKEARVKYVQAVMISEKEGQKPGQEKFAKTTVKSETLKRTGR
ncbi:MAG: hypothetical protein PHN19_02305 [Patescibacteria group bacterium]|nr:hypothetical protein [Patescibacteria group bacterium]